MLHFIYVIPFLLTFIGCHDGSGGNSSFTSPSISNKSTKFALLGPLSGANVSLVLLDANKTIAKTTTKTYDKITKSLTWGNYSVGSFEIDNLKKYSSQSWVKISISGGKDIDSNDDGIVTDSLVPLNGNLTAYMTLGDFENSFVSVNIFTTIAATLYAHDINNTQNLETFLSEIAKKIFAKSIDVDDTIDYKDLFAYIPNETPNTSLKNPNLYKQLINNGVMEKVLHGEDLYTLLKSDADNDGLNFFQEMQYGTSPSLSDTDGDGIDDIIEINQGTNPLLKDSDYDGISDKDESLYGTSATNSDTDSDYIPDGVELQDGTDPLNGDENGNGVADGLDGDPFFKYQWYIKSYANIITNTANVPTVLGNDLDILDVYHQLLGSSKNTTIIQVIDVGVEATHEDLDVDMADSFNAVTKNNDPTPTTTVDKNNPTSPLDSGHGTAVASIIAAKTNNGVGIRGIIPRAKIAGSNWLEDQTLGELDRVWYSQINDDNITVSNNSWGTYYLNDDGFERILKLGTEQLRNSKGRVYVFAAGNDREDYGNSNLSYLTNNPYVITVAALNAQDKYASYSDPGSNILVSAYGGEHYYTGPTIMSASRSGSSYYKSELNGQKGVITVDEDTKRNYTYAFNGTSAAAPMVSGSIGLLLDACPSLTWRDVRWVIAHTAKKVDSSDQTWIKNKAGLWYSPDYGFGKINPLGMIQMCRSKYFNLLPPMQHASVATKYNNVTIPDTNTTISKVITFDKNYKIEWVGLTVDSNHPFSGDLEINLISPSGTKINIIKPNQVKFAGYDGGFRFSSVAFMDENSKGDWTVELTDRLKNDEGELNGITLEVDGYTQ